MNIVEVTAYRIFGNLVDKKVNNNKYIDIKHQLRKAVIPVPVVQYVSLAYFYSLITGLVIGSIGFYASLVVFSDTGALFVFKDLLPNWIEAYALELMACVQGILIFLIGFYTTYFVYLSIPSLKANIRKTSIDQSLIHVTTYLYAMTRGGGLSLFDIFKSLSNHKHIYGTAAEEFGYIVRDMEFFGHDIITALQNAKLRTPSQNFRELIDGLISILSSGGDITAYLKNKTEQYRSVAKTEQQTFLETLGILAESYVSVFVVAPLFLMTILVVLGLLNPTSILIMYLLIYIAVPFGTMVFLILLDTITSDQQKLPETYVTEKSLNVFDDLHVKFSKLDEELIKKIEFQKRITKIKDSLKHPIHLMRGRPSYAFVLSIPVALFYFLNNIIGRYQFDFNIKLVELSTFNIDFATYIDDYIFYSVLIMIVPFIVFHELRAKRISQIEEQIPEFFKKLASINEAGIMLMDAISMTAQSKVGIIHTEIGKMKEDINWGTNLTQALKKFEYRVRTDLTRRIVTTIIKASESTNDVTSVLNIAANDAEVQKQMKNQRSTEMYVYVFIIYMAFFVYLFIVYILTVHFLSSMPSTMGDSVAGMTMVNSINIEEYEMLFFHASMIQGFCSGLVAGQMGNASINSGLKHSIIMIVSSYALFALLI
ncbi:Type II secretion system F domain protein [Methanohalobium evestigatum Z-7303]|uniref:Type II secretion system F domain protein n=1 Tax=Methanohalobium evestigatum (strain ATCC BAA-1072 / DSM 3721 / NBRC 107634 / OCM 161 / Z-7303) TaxID=644295 RepID=D7E9J5_METEZ|nr:type II secretion system F family protein [Methanohalobium evestigatum]ADI74267.1 Type II secretion system F domain protein [Methanohalobium evestigatum Z-7303]